jgi:hypothetical protein
MVKFLVYEIHTVQCQHCQNTWYSCLLWQKSSVQNCYLWWLKPHSEHCIITVFILDWHSFSVILHIMKINSDNTRKSNVAHLFHEVSHFSTSSLRPLIHLSCLSYVVTFHNSGETEVTLCEWWSIQQPQFLPLINFKAGAKNGQVYQCAQRLCWKIITLQENKWATQNIVMTSQLIFMI